MHKLHQFVRRLQLLGCLEKLVLAHADQSADFALHQSHVTHGLHHITCARLTLGANHRSTLSNTAQSLAQVLSTTHEGHVELCLVDMVDIVGGREHFAFVNIVDLDGLQYLSLGDVADAAFCHHGDAHGLLNATNHLRVTHARYASSRTDVGRNTFKRHHGTGTSLFSDAGLFRSCYVHNHTTLQHLGQIAV